MLRILGSERRLCDGLSRRDLMQVGGLGLAGGLSLPMLLASEEARAVDADAPAKSVILINLMGGPSHIDMFDMKPKAPTEIRGEFRPIPSSVPGLDVCELMPLTMMPKRASKMSRRNLTISTSPTNVNWVSTDRSELTSLASEELQLMRRRITSFCVYRVETRKVRTMRLSRRGWKTPCRCMGMLSTPDRPGSSVGCKLK